MPTDWTIHTGGGAGAAAQSTLESRSGRASLAYASPSSGLPPLELRSTRVPFASTQSGEASAAAKEDAGAFVLSVDFFSAAGTFLAKVDIPRTPSAQWQVDAVSFDIPRCATALEFVITSSTGTIGNVDDVAVQVIPWAPDPAFIVKEDWDRGLTGWTTLGSAATIDCSDGMDAPSLKMDPCCASYSRTIRSSTTIPLSAPLLVSVDFKGDGASSTDADITIGLAGTNSLNFHLSGGSSNREVSLHTIDRNLHEFSSMMSYEPGTWYRAVMIIDPVAGTVRAEIHDIADQRLAVSTLHAIPVGQTAITTFFFQTIDYEGETSSFHFDRLRISGHPDPAPQAPIMVENFSAGLGHLTIIGSAVIHDCSKGTPACSLKIDPVCCGSYAYAGKWGLTAPLTRPVIATFDFQGTGGSTTDGDFVLALDGVDVIDLHLSSGGANREATLHTESGGTHSYAPFFTWSTNTWYRAWVFVDTISGTTRAEIRSAGGDLLAVSESLPIPYGNSDLTAAYFQGIDYGSTSATHHYDSLQIRYAS